jgi:hypothetical protein
MITLSGLIARATLTEEQKKEHFSKIQQRMHLRRDIASRIMRSCIERPAIADQIDAEYDDARLDLVAQESVDRLTEIRRILKLG